MGRIPARIAAILLAIIVALLGVVGAFVLSCVALYEVMAGVMAPPLAALVSAAIVLGGALVVALLVVAIGWRGVRRSSQDSLFVAGSAIGTLLADRVQQFAEENPRASLVMSLLAGFISGARR